MDEKIEEIIQKANKNSYYSILLISFGFLIFVTTNVISSTIGFYSIEPIVNFTLKNGTNISGVNLNQTICQNYKWINTSTDESTWYYSYGDECSQIITFMINYLSNFGSLVGLISLPYVIKWLGQKNTILWTGYLYSIVCFVNIFMPDFASALIFSFLNNVTGTTMELAFFMLCAENVKERIRTFTLNVVGGGYCFSAIIFIALFWTLNSWKIPFIISAASNLILTVFIHIFLYENPRYYLKLGKVEMFIRTLQKIAKFNRCEKEFDPLAKAILKEFYDEQDELERSHVTLDQANKSLLAKFRIYVDNIENERSKYTILDVFRFKSHRYIFLLMCFVNFCGNGVYQSYSIHINTFSNPYLSGIIAYSIQGVFCILSSFVMNFSLLKRKGLLVLSISFVMVIGIIMYIWQNDFSNNLKNSLNITMLAFSYIFFQVTWTYNAEVYSSKLLNLAFSANNMCGTVGSMVLPVINNYYPDQIYLAYSIFLVFCIVAFFFLPETYGKAINHNIPEELENEQKSETFKRLASDI